MFAGDFNRKGVFASYVVSTMIHVCIFLLLLTYTKKQKDMLADYVLTEVTMIQELPEVQAQPQRPVEIEKPKSFFDMLRQAVPIRQEAKLELAKPQKLELEKPKIEMDKPKALALDKQKLDIKPAMKAIDLDNEIGQKSISPQMVQQQLALQKQQQLAAAPKKALDLAANKPSTALPGAARPAINVGAAGTRAAPLRQSAIKLGQPTPEPQKKAVDLSGSVNIPKKDALLIQGQISGRRMISAAKPVFPRWAQQQGINATVTIFFVVIPSGTVKGNAYVEVTSGYEELDKNALEAVLKFRFEPISSSEDQSGYATIRYMLE